MTMLQGLFGPPNVEELKAKGDIKGLIKALGYKKDERVQQNAINALEEIGEPAVFPLISSIKEGGPELRRKAPEALGKIGAPGVEPLIRHLRAMADPQGRNPDVCLAFASALGKVGEPAVEPLIAVLKEDPYAKPLPKEGPLGRIVMQEYVCDALVEVGEPAVESLITALKARDFLMIFNVVKVLGEIGDARAVEPLIGVLYNGSEMVRKEATLALGEIGDLRAVEPLIHILGDKDKSVVFAAIESLGKLGDGRAEGPIIMASESWLKKDQEEINNWATMDKMLGRPKGENVRMREKEFDSHKTIVQEALNLLHTRVGVTGGGSAKASKPPTKDGKDHAQAVAHVQAGIDLCKSQQWDQAILELNQAVDIEPGSAKAHQLLAICYGAKLDTESAVKHFQILRKLDVKMARELEDNPLFAMVLKGGVITLD